MISLITRLRRRHPRTRLAWLALWALLLQQLVLVAYACPIEAQTPPDPVPMIMVGCDGMTALDPDYPSLCQQHCERDRVTTPDLKSPQVPPSTVPVLFTSLETLSSSVQARRYRDVPACVSDPPPAQRFCSLQI
ncbi:MAG: hypothetical protein KF823_08865 [Xanthomonadales bacterium]|nr:hypothetical protein [Xanthomonadales bacterium]